MTIDEQIAVMYIKSKYEAAKIVQEHKDDLLLILGE